MRLEAAVKESFPVAAAAAERGCFIPSIRSILTAANAKTFLTSCTLADVCVKWTDFILKWSFLHAADKQELQKEKKNNELEKTTWFEAIA